MKPDIGIYDPRFKYVPSHLTNLRETFAKVRAEGRESKPIPVDERHLLFSRPWKWPYTPL